MTDNCGGLNKRLPWEAIKIVIIHGAFASFEEHERGSLEPGKLADLVVMGVDPVTADPMNIINIPVEKTMVGGKWVYEME